MGKLYWAIVGFIAGALPLSLGMIDATERLAGAIIVLAIGYVGSYIRGIYVKSTSRSVIRNLDEGHPRSNYW